MHTLLTSNFLKDKHVGEKMVVFFFQRLDEINQGVLLLKTDLILALQYINEYSVF